MISDKLRTKELQNRILLCTYDENQPLTKTEWNDEKLQVRGVDQTPYPSLLHGASLATAMQRLCRPLLLVMN